jgi:WD40 repeat protein
VSPHSSRRWPLALCLTFLPIPAAAQDKPRLDLQGDPLPAGALARMGSNRLRHLSEVQCLAVSPDGKTVATAGQEEGIWLWDAATGAERGRITGRDVAVVSLAFSPDGKRLAGGTLQGPLGIWEVATGKSRGTLGGRNSSLRYIAFSPDGQTVTGGTDGDELWAWDANGKELFHLPKHGRAAFSPDGTVLATGGADGSVALRDPRTGKQLRQLPVGEGADALSWVGQLRFSPDGKTLTCAGFSKGLNCGVQVWDVKEGKRTMARSFELWRPLALSRDGKTLAMAWDGIKFWDLAADKELRTIPLKEGSLRQLGELSPDGKTLVSARGREIDLWDVGTGKALLPPKGHRYNVEQVAFAPDGKTVASWGNDGGLRVWDAATGKELHSFHDTVFKSLAYSPDGRALAAVGSTSACVWDVATGKKLYEVCDDIWVMDATFSPDGKLLATAETEAVGLWDAASGKPVHRLAAGSNRISAVAFTRDGKRLLGFEERKLVRAWDPATGKEVRYDPPAAPPAEPLVLSADRRELATVDGARIRAGLFEPPASGTRRGLPGPIHEHGVAVSPDRRLVAGTHDPAALSVWELATGKVVFTVRADPRDAPVVPLAFAPDGKRLVSGAPGGTLLVWSLAPAKADARQPEKLWEELIGDPAAAYRAGWELAEAGPRAVALLEKHLLPAKKVDPDADVRKLIKDLDAEEFAVRENASKELKQIGKPAEPFLRKALDGNPSAEVRRRIEELLEAGLEARPVKNLPPGILDGEPLRTVRAIRVLEQIGTPEARTILEKLAKGDPDARETQEAKGSLERLSAPRPDKR